MKRAPELATVTRRDTPVDAIVVGSGANGGVAARQLTAAGLRVLVLEAGRPLAGWIDHGTRVTNGARHLYRHFVSRRQLVQQAHPTYWNTNPDLFVDDIDNPYLTPPDMPFRWIRGRQVGGRTLTWDAVMPRFSDVELGAAELDGHGPSWPIRHSDLAPYYADLERFFGVHGSRDGLAQLPDGDFLPPRPMTHGEKIFKQRVERAFGDRKVIVSRGIHAGRSPDFGQKFSRASSQATTLRAAARTGNMELRSHSIVSRILLDKEGKARGVEVIDALTHAVTRITARVVFLCASTIESVRILLNSRTPEHPFGLGGSSDVLGRYLMDHSASNTYFYMPGVQDDGTTHALFGSDAIMIPRFQNLTGQSSDFLRGFGMWGGIQRIAVPNLFRKQPGVSFGFLCSRAEMLPHADNRITLDATQTDAWGVPVPHIACEWKAQDRALANAERQMTVQTIEAAGGQVADFSDLFHLPFVGERVRGMEKQWELSTPGMFVHEVGGARMGSDRRSSVVDPNCRVWDAPNVFVTDGACWPTSGWQNPTLTEMAITARACDHAVGELKRMNL